MNFTFRFEKDGKVIQRCQTHNKRRFLYRIGTLNWQNRPLKVYLRVYYGKHENNFGKKVAFYNNGYYNTKRDSLFAFLCFTEKDLTQESEDAI